MKKTFDDIIRRRWEEQQFPIHDDHRANMIELLEGKKKRRAFAIWWWGAGAVVLLAGFFLWQASDTTNEKQPEATANEMAVAEKAMPETAAVEPVQPATKSSTAEVNETSSQLSNSSTINTVENTSAINNSTTRKQKDNIISSNTATANATVLTVSKRKQSSDDASNNKAAKTNNTRTTHISTSETALPSSIPLTKTTENIAQATLVDVLSANSVERETSPINVETSPGIAVDNTNPVVETVVSPAPVANRASVDVAWLDALPVEQLPINSEHSMGTIVPANKMKHPLYVFGEAGVGLVLPSKNKYDAGLKLNAGAGLGYLLSPKLHLMLSGGYLMQDGGFDFQRTSTVTSFGFGARSQVNSLEPERLHFIYSKLGVVYRIKRHSVGISAGLQWLYGAQGDITVYTSGDFDPPTENTQKAWLSLNGLNRSQWNAALQYGYRLTPRINLAAGTHYYFTSLITTDAALDAQGYDWEGITAKVQPFFTINYLLYGPF